MSPKLQGLRGEQRGNGSGRRFGELSDLVGVLLDQVHANLILHHTGLRHGTDGSDLIYWSMVLVDVTGASEVPPKNICHPSASPAPSLLRVVVARVRPLSQSCSSPTRRPDQEVERGEG